MSMRYKGGVISATPPTVTPPADGEGGSASGIWSLETQGQYEGDSGWPKPVLPKELYAWGRNNAGQLAQGNTTNRSSPVQIGSLVNWSNQITQGTNSCLAIKNDGTLWAWGANGNGELAQGDTAQRNSPVQVGALTTWLRVAAGYTFCAAVKTDGTLWAWGNNSLGQLGQGNTTNYSSPVQVGALTDWQQVDAGYNACAAVKTDGTLWTWGQNTEGRLGLSDTTNRSSPVQVGALTTWASVRIGFKYMHGVTTGGELYAWGYNSNGQLGTSNTVTYQSPVQVGSLSSWSKAAPAKTSTAYHTVATTTDGKLYAWGYNGAGQLGQGDTTQRSSPVQVGALTTWLEPSAGSGSSANDTSLATKTDGTLWTWGYNGFGQLGINLTSNRSSPVQVGADTSWLRAVVSDNSVLATKTS